MILVISKYIHTSSNYMQYTQESTRFCDLSWNFGTGSLARGWYLPKFFCIYLGLSLSLSLSPPLEERTRGEVRGSWTRSGPTTQFPYLVNAPPILCRFTDCPPSIALHLPLPIQPYSHNEPLCFASHMCVCQRPSLPVPLTLLLSRSPTISYPIPRGNNFVSVHHVAHAIEQILSRRCLHMEFF